MSCNIKSRTIDFLKEEKAISNNREIVDPFLFNKFNKRFTQEAHDKYGVGDGKTMLFSSRTREFAYGDKSGYGFKYMFDTNNEMFDLLDEAVSHYQRTKIGTKPATEKTREEFNTIFKGEKEINALDALDTIIAENSKLKGIAEFLKEKISGLEEIKIKKVYDVEGTYAGAYYNSQRPIELNAAVEPGKTVASTLLHELFHYITSDVVKDFNNEKTAALEKLYEQAAKYLPKETYYEMSNLDEFAVGIFTNSNFIKKLKSIPPVNDREVKNFKNLFEQLLDFILDVIGLPKGDNLYEQAFAVTTNIIEENVKKLQEEKMALEDMKKRTPLYSIAMPGDPSLKYKQDKEQAEEETETIFETPDKTKNTEEQAELELEETKYIELRDISDKLKYSLLEINKSLDINIEKFNELHHRYNRQEKTGLANYMGEKKREFKDLKEKINTYHDTQHIRGVVDFLQTMLNQLSYMERKLDGIDHSDEKEVYFTYKNYNIALHSFGVIDKLQDNIATIKQDPNQKIVTKSELEKIEKLVKDATGRYSYLENRLKDLSKKHMKVFLNDIKYFSQIQTDHRERLRKEHSTNKIAEDFETWYPKMLQKDGRDYELVQQDLQEEIDKLINDPFYDIAASNMMLHSAINTGSTTVQILNQMLKEVKNKRMEFERAKDREFKEMFDAVVAEYGSYNPTEAFKNILQYDKNGMPYLIGEFKVGLLEIKEKRRELFKKQKELEKTEGIDSPAYNKVRAELHQLEVDNFREEGGKRIPLDKWRNNLDKLSETDKKVLNFFRSITENAAHDTYYKAPLIQYFGMAKFYELPKITKSDMERFITKKTSGAIKDKWKDMTTIRTDDVGFRKIDVDGTGNPIMSVPIHYRDSRDNRMDPKDQSIDLFNVYRLEYKNAISYKLRSEVEMEMNMLTDLVKHGRGYARNKLQIDRRSGKFNPVKGADTNTYKMMRGMMEARLYDILHKHGGTLWGMDANKVVGFMNGVTSVLGMSFNITSGVANVVNANAQLFLESFIKGQFITAKGIKKANSIYGKHMKDTLLDNNKPIKESFVNQLLEIFDVKGLINLSDADFLKNTLIRNGLSRDALQVFQNSGEHWVQSVIAMSVLEGIKVMNAKNEYINKEGKVVKSKKEAASLLDMLEKDDKGLLQVSDKVVYTTHSKINSWKEGGKEMVDMLIQKKIFDSVGNYTQDMQPELKKHWWGKMVGMYRNYLIPMGVARLRGVQYSTKKKDELEDHEKTYSYALQEYEEGTYTSLIRYVVTNLKEKQYNLLATKNWNQLSDYEKHNIKRAVTELIVSMVMIPLVLAALGAMADEDDDALFFIMYQIRRLDTELSQYRSITEMFKIMRSPIPSARILETSTSIFGSVFTLDFLDTYEAGKHEGSNKLLIKTGKQLPIVKDFLRSYQDLYEFQNSNWGAGL
jgi:hypothetical protein